MNIFPHTGTSNSKWPCGPLTWAESRVAFSRDLFARSSFCGVLSFHTFSFYICHFPNSLHLGQEWHSHNQGTASKSRTPAAVRSLWCCSRLSLLTLKGRPVCSPSLSIRRCVAPSLPSGFMHFVDYAAFHQTADIQQMDLKLVLKSKWS